MATLRQVLDAARDVDGKQDNVERINALVSRLNNELTDAQGQRTAAVAARNAAVVAFKQLVDALDEA